MTPKGKAIRLIKFTFDPVAGSTNVDKEKFLLIEAIAKDVAKKMVNELIAEINLYRSVSEDRLDFWEKVLNEIDEIQ